MKTALLSRLPILLLAFWLVSCGASTKNESVEIELKLTGEMLFEGANTLQVSGENQLIKVGNELDVEASAIKNVSVSAAVIELDDSSKEITESLLLQLVSDNNELFTIGTLSPLPDGNNLSLSMAENTSILPYLEDDGLTWVLDLNINEDHMDEMIVTGILTLIVDYIPSDN
ncbi:MAG TPA: hypothetical protein VJ894_05305 [Cryomorphaceae bacterium]|nr:hypothetical protein [Cryomorphaceae bacterium]